MHQATKAHSSPHRGAAGRKIDETTSPTCSSGQNLLEIWEIVDGETEPSSAVLLTDELDMRASDALFNIETIATAVNRDLEAVEKNMSRWSRLEMEVHISQLQRLTAIIFSEVEHASEAMRNARPLRRQVVA